MGADPTRAESLPWHRRPVALARFVADLVADELAHLRPGGVPLPNRPWPAELALDEQGLGLDSLERLSIAAALNEALHLHESGVEDLLLAHRRFGDWLQVAATGLATFDGWLTFRTSGCSGVAKACPHALANLLQEVEHLAHGALPRCVGENAGSHGAGQADAGVRQLGNRGHRHPNGSRVLVSGDALLVARCR